jgi:serine/threonine-protein kinase
MFHGEDAAETLAAVIQKKPDLQRVPTKVRRLLESCLEKDPKKRLRDIGDAWRVVEESGTPPATAPPGISRRAWMQWITTALMIAAATLAVWGWLRTSPVAPRPVLRWQLTLPPGTLTGTGVALSSDGSELAYEDSGKLWVRQMDQLEARPVSGTENGLRPFFSPDGKWLAYFSVGIGPLKKIPVTGGTALKLCDGAGFFGGSWSGGSIIFSSVNSLMRVSEQGGSCEPLTKPSGGEIHRWPQILPGGRSVLFTVAAGEGNLDSARIAVLDLKTREYRIVVHGGANARYVPSGHLVYVRGGTLFAVPFDLKHLATVGPETPVVDALDYNPAGGFADYSFSESGLFAYVSGTGAATDRILAWVDMKGMLQPLPATPSPFANLRLSPDGQRVAVAIGGRNGGSGGIWVYDLRRGTLTRLTSEGFNNLPVWTPDGRRVAFGRLNSGIHWVPSDGSGNPEMVVKSPGLTFPVSWTPDGKVLLYQHLSPKAEMWMVTAPGTGGLGRPQRLFGESSFNQGSPRISPDGRWVAFQSDESGMYQVYLRPFPGPGGLTPVSVDGGGNPMWSGDGRELFFLGRNKPEMMAVDVETSPTLRLSTPRVLFSRVDAYSADVAPDGKRFLVSLPARSGVNATTSVTLNMVENWFEDLRRVAPQGH